MNSINKKYFTIGEIAKHFNVKASLIRYYETEFNIKSSRSKTNRRMYKKEDIEHFSTIFDLLKVKKLTIKGAKEYMNKNINRGEKKKILQSLQEMQNFLLSLNEKI